VYGADKPIAYGDSAEFWESHALVVASFRDPELNELLVQDCIPPRYPAGTRIHPIKDSKGFLKTSLDEIIVDRNLVKELKQSLWKKDVRILCIVREVEGMVRVEHAVPLRKSDTPLLFLSADTYASYAMLPDEMQEGVEGKALVSRTLRLCDALATGAPLAKVKKLEAILADKPSVREKAVVNRALNTAIRDWQSALATAKKLSCQD